MCFKVVVVIYILTDSPPVASSRRRGKTHRKDHSVGNVDSSIVNEPNVVHYGSNNFDDEDVDDADGKHNADELMNFSTNDQVYFILLCSVSVYVNKIKTI